MVSFGDPSTHRQSTDANTSNKHTKAQAQRRTHKQRRRFRNPETDADGQTQRATDTAN